MIRSATHDDIPWLVETGDAFHKAAGHREEHIREDYAQTLANLIEGGIILRSDSGVIGGIVFPCYFNFAEKWAQELFWWSEGRDGMALLRAFEARAKDMGAGKIIMSRWESLRPKAVDRVLRAEGYAPIETSYEKVL